MPENGRFLSSGCPQLGERGHGSWYFDCAVPVLPGRRERLRRGGYLTRREAIAEANYASRVALGGPTTDFTPSSERLHGLIVQAANNQRLAQEIDKTRLIYFSRPIAAMYTTEEIEESIAEHEAVAQAIDDQVPDAADAAMRHHIKHALDHVVRKLAWLT